MAPGIIFLLCIIGAVFFFCAGWLVKGQKDKPVYLPETTTHTLEEYPHHYHDHDMIPIKK